MAKIKTERSCDTAHRGVLDENLMAANDAQEEDGMAGCWTSDPVDGRESPVPVRVEIKESDC